MIKYKGEDKIEVEGDLEEIEETFYEQTVSSEDLEDIKVNPKIENLHKNNKEELEQIEEDLDLHILSNLTEMHYVQRYSLSKSVQKIPTKCA